MCNKAAATYPSATHFVPECYMSQEMHDKAANICPFLFGFVPDQYLIKKYATKLFSKKLLC